MRRRVGLKWVAGVVLAGAVVFGACKLRSSSTQSSELTQVVAVTRGNLTATVSPTGQVASQHQADLTFDVSRLPVTEVLVASGQEVKKGDVLVEIDPSSLERAVEQAKANLLSAEEALARAKEPYTALDLQKARLDVAQAEAALAEVSQNDSAELIRQAESGLESARLNLILTTSGSSAGKTVRDLQYTTAWHERNVSNLRVQLSQGKATANDVTEAEQALSRAQAQLSVAQATASAAISAAQTRVTEAEKTLADLRAGAKSVALANWNNKVALAEYNLARAKDSLSKVETGADAKTVQLAQAWCDSAKAALEQAQATLESATMVAPFDGTVTSVGVAVGDLVSSGTRVVTLADLSKLEVVATVDETEINQVKVGQSASITFDALSGAKFTGKVVEVPLAGQLVQNVVSYDVVLSLEGSGGESLLPGMTANVTIVVGQRQNALLLPALAIAQDDSGDVVTLEGSNETVPVQVGLSNGTYVEVVRGLNEGDKVVIAYSSTSSDSTRFPGAGMGVMVEIGGGGAPPQAPPGGR
ncbi:MAG: Macrolide export protein MacA [Chloroflexi bacterium ADurb.Bin180]|nr:MAG: Macrolide export protein MacA [Chloroflexi bacterium ADurb.Bin180]